MKCSSLSEYSTDSEPDRQSSREENIYVDDEAVEDSGEESSGGDSSSSSSTSSSSSDELPEASEAQKRHASQITTSTDQITRSSEKTGLPNRPVGNVQPKRKY